MSESSSSTGTTKPPASTPATTSGSGSGSGKSGKSGALSGAELDRKRRAAGTTPEAAAELEALGVDPRLDNRTGDQRPTAPGPLKPQQFPGPEVGHFAEHAEEVGGEFTEATARAVGEPVGMRSTGALGRGDDDE